MKSLLRKDNTYDIILVLSFNTHPIRKGRGSAIFIHIAKKNYKKTSGCIAVKKNDLKRLLKLCPENKSYNFLTSRTKN